MKKVIKLITLLLVATLMVACNQTGEQSSSSVKSSSSESSSTITEPMTVKEVLETEDLTYVEFVGIIIGYDLGMRHIVVEDKDGGASIQLYKNPGFPWIKVGDEVLVKGYRTYDREVNRLVPESVEVLSSGNPSSVDNPIVLSSEDLFNWTNENRVNPDILFKYYKFENVEIKSVSNSYTYIDDQYDEEGGRGLKIGIKNDSSVYAAENFVVGQKYTFSAILYGISDDFYDESRDGLVLRLSVMSEDDVELINEGEDALVVVTGQQSFRPNEAEKPDFTTYFNVVDPVDGAVTVTADMITESVDMTTVGEYPVTLTYTNTEGHTTIHTITIIITDEGVSVTEALNSEIGKDLYVKGVVIGYGLNTNGSGAKRALVIEDPENGNAIEIWATATSYNKVKVGDLILVRGQRSVEKELPRLANTTLLEVLSSDNPLTAPIVIEDLHVWTNDKLADSSKYFGRYTFTAKVVDKSGSYTFFTRHDGTENILQFAYHNESAVPYNFEIGSTYEVTGVVYGISDPLSAIAQKSITVRFGIMNENDVKLVSTGEDETPSEYLTVTDAINADVGTNLTISGVVIGYGVNSNNYKTALVIEDPANGNAIEMWINTSNNFDEVKVGDLIAVSGIKKIEKGLPRLDSEVLVEIISSDNALTEPTLIEDLEAWTAAKVADHSDFLGRYTFTGTVKKISSSYVYFTIADGENILQFTIHQDQSLVKYEWNLDETYTVTGVIYGISDPFTALETKSIAIRMGIMNETDVVPLA